MPPSPQDESLESRPARQHAFMYEIHLFIDVWPIYDNDLSPAPFPSTGASGAEILTAPRDPGPVCLAEARQPAALAKQRAGFGHLLLF